MIVATKTNLEMCISETTQEQAKIIKLDWQERRLGKNTAEMTNAMSGQNGDISGDNLRVLEFQTAARVEEPPLNAFFLSPHPRKNAEGEDHWVYELI